MNNNIESFLFICAITHWESWRNLQQGDSDLQKYGRVDLCTAKHLLTGFIEQGILNNTQKSFPKEHRSETALNWKDRKD